MSRSDERRYVRVAPELALHKQFDYAVPEGLRGTIEAGHRLKVPWGNRTILAYALDFPAQPEVAKVREVIGIVGSEPLIPRSLCELGRWMASYYCCETAQALKALLPEAVRRTGTGEKMRLWVTPVAGVEEAVTTAKLARAKRQQAAWALVRNTGGGWLAELAAASGTGPEVWRQLEAKGLVTITPEVMDRNPFADRVETDRPPVLNPEQEAALKAILAETGEAQPRPVLLQGVTGSGKTEVYLRAMEQVLSAGRSVLMLVPEIALTPQTIGLFRARFEGRGIRVAVLHSHLSAGERHDQWHQIHRGEARVVIGARSAVFAPLRRPGLIVVDEEHEASYKQEETPHYHARDVAVMRGRLEGVPVVLGSATPSLESVYNARQGKYRLLRLAGRIDARALPVIHVLDLRKERKAVSGPVLLSARLKEAVEGRLRKKEQAILFLNRRGFSTSLQCPSCGHVEECPHCAVPLTYHRTGHDLKCHLCGFSKKLPPECPSCGFTDYRYAGVGTQKIEEAVQREFPGARIQRMDSDSMRGKRAHAEALERFQKGETDLLVGTQMIAKGLHFPNVTCVGVIHVDAALQLPDFRASERVFQQLVQVAGRAGRGRVPGEVYIQTYTPFHPAIQFARHHDVEGFQDQELEYRRAHHYPPFRRAALVTFRGKSEEKVRFCAEQAARAVAKELPPETDEPEAVPAPIARIKDEFRYHLFFKTGRVLELGRVLRKAVLEPVWPEGIRAGVNIDPVSLL